MMLPTPCSTFFHAVFVLLSRMKIKHMEVYSCRSTLVNLGVFSVADEVLLNSCWSCRFLIARSQFAWQLSSSPPLWWEIYISIWRRDPSVYFLSHCVRSTHSSKGFMEIMWHNIVSHLLRVVSPTPGAWLSQDDFWERCPQTKIQCFVRQTVTVEPGWCFMNANIPHD